MGTTTKIQWCDSTASPWTVCTPVSDGCRNCYARGEAKRRGWSAEWGAGVPRHRFATFEQRVMAMEKRSANGHFVECPLCQTLEFTTNGRCKCGRWYDIARPRVFPSLCDWLDPEATPEMLAHYLDVVRRSPHLDHMMLSKRVGLWRERLNAAIDYWANGAIKWEAMGWGAAWLNGSPPANVWIGATVEGPEQLWRVADLLLVPAVRRFVSVEPMLGPVDFRHMTMPESMCPLGPKSGQYDAMQHLWRGGKIDAVFCGGESGAKARPMHPDWPRGLRDQCVAAGVGFTFKQWGEWGRREEHGLTLDDLPYMRGRMGFWRDGTFIEGLTTDRDCEHMVRVGAKLAGRLLDGRTWDGKEGGR